MKLVYTTLIVISSCVLYAQDDCSKLKTEYAKLSATLDKKANELESFKQKNIELDNLISSQQKAIEEQKDAVAKMIAKGEEAHEQMMLAKTAIEQYESLIEVLQGKLEELVKANDALSKENERLKKQ